MANPLTLYIPIKQDLITQGIAESLSKNFAKEAKTGLDHVQSVHYARIALVPNVKPDPETGAKTHAVLLLTEFDRDMTTYLQAFWKNDGILAAFKLLAGIMLNGPKDPGKFTFPQFQNFIVENNLSNDINSNYSAYPELVTDILEAFPPAGSKK